MMTLLKINKRLDLVKYTLTIAVNVNEEGIPIINQVSSK